MSTFMCIVNQNIVHAPKLFRLNIRESVQCQYASRFFYENCQSKLMRLDNRQFYGIRDMFGVEIWREDSSKDEAEEGKNGLFRDALKKSNLKGFSHAGTEYCHRS